MGWKVDLEKHCVIFDTPEEAKCTCEMFGEFKECYRCRIIKQCARIDERERASLLALI